MAASENGKISKVQILLIALFFLVGLIVILLFMLGIYNLGRGSSFFSLPNTQPAAETAENGTNGYYELFGPEGFTVNLNDSSQRRYLKTGIVIAYQDEKLLVELEKRQSELRDKTITVLRRWSAFDLAQEEGLDTLRDELLLAVNTVLSQGEIKDVYFTEFIVQ